MCVPFVSPTEACELQDMAVMAGMDHVRYDYQAPHREIDASHPKYVFDREPLHPVYQVRSRL